MKIDIQSCDFPFPLSDSLRAYVVSSITIALSHQVENIQRIRVSLSHVNDPRSWSDKCCAIHVELRNTSGLVIENTETDLYAAINCAVNRTKYTLQKRLLTQANSERIHKLSDEVSMVE